MANGRGHTGHRWRQVRREVLARRPLFCYFCGHEINPRLTFPDPASPQVHCIIPVSRGGTTTVDNCAPSHMRCNQEAGNRLPAPEFIPVEGLDP